MDHSESMEVCLECMARILIRSFFMGFALLIVWFLFFAVGADWIHRMHSQWFAMSQSSFNVIHYCGIALLKIILIVFFLIPYFSIRLVLKSRKRSSTEG